jgi:YegS/Rv2252/BmrU family lipid kinase
VRLQLVVNPAAGGGRASSLLPQVQRGLADHDLVVTETTSLHHADELTADAIADDRVVGAMGGDGLVGREAGTDADRDGVMAVVPGGRGNDFARRVGVPADVLEACRLISEGIETAVDIGDVDGHAFVGIASVGFDSDVQERVLRTRVPLGQLVYLYGALAAVRAWRPARFTLTVDGEPDELVGWSVVAANSGMYGGGMRIAPDADVADGLLDVVTISECSRRHFLKVLPRVFKGTHVSDPVVAQRRARSIKIDADRPFRVFADGDPISALPCTVSVRPAALRLILPRP